ncbi:NADH:ubiquinone oxidoreductase subunit NDUFA12 [Rhodobacteraceae bacterium NNCM2]|nr:NADH:ubiquinone oxidoreductase subunit NDUFA12 [Coraliihabitans acroporae]
MSLFAEIFTWWNGQTIGTRLWTKRNGQKVGEDDAGNVFYQTSDGKRRWVIYNGVAEASAVSPDWHGWLHHTFDEPPKDGHLPRKKWEKDHIPNMTGTDRAYHPPGSVLSPETRPKVTGDYDAWQPE